MFDNNHWLVRQAQEMYFEFSNVYRLKQCEALKQEMVNSLVHEVDERKYPTLPDPMDCSQAPLFVGFPRQEYWSGLLCPSAGYLSNPGIELGSLALWADSLPSEPPDGIQRY